MEKIKNIIHKKRASKDSADFEPPRESSPKQTPPHSPRSPRHRSDRQAQSSGLVPDPSSGGPSDQTPSPPIHRKPVKHGQTASVSGGQQSSHGRDSESHLDKSKSRESRPERRPTDATIADDYAAYLPALSAKSSSVDSEHMSLGGDRRLMSDPSTLRHSKDVANRNIHANSRHGSGGNSNGSTTHRSLRNGSLKGSVGKGSFGGLSEEDADEPYIPDRSSWPKRTARGESRAQQQLRNNDIRRVDDSVRQSTSGKQNSIANYQTTLMDGSTEGHSEARRREELQAQLDGIIDLNNTEDIDQTIRYAPAVTHEVVKPHQHEIIEEVIYREIHNHDVYHRILPVYQTEILPPRHFVPNPTSEGLIEVPEHELPEEYRHGGWRWYIAEKEKHRHAAAKMDATSKPRVHVTKPTIISEKSYMTPEGFERKETVWRHPPTLEDLSDYTGPVKPIIFNWGWDEKDLPKTPENQHQADDHDGQSMNPRGLQSELPQVNGAIPDQAVPPRRSSTKARTTTTTTTTTTSVAQGVGIAL